MMFKKRLGLISIVLLATIFVGPSEGATSATQPTPKKLRDAWLRFEACREAAVAQNQEAQLERCLATALPRSATHMEKQKAVQFLNLDLKPKVLFECPSSLSEARGQKAMKQARENGIQFGCFEIKLSGPPFKGEIEFAPLAPDAADSFRVHKVRYGF